MPVNPLLAQARKLGNPVIEGDQVTFLWQGARPPVLIDDLHNWDDNPQKMSRVKNELWAYTLELPEDGYLEYAFLDESSGERLPDPLNPNRIENGVDAYNHFFYMPKAKPSPLTQTRRGIPHGNVTRIEIPTHDLAVGTRRTVHLYQPPVEGPVPLVVVYDGTDYLHRGKLNVIVDNLIADGKIHPFAMAMVQNGGQARVVEYSCGESTLDFLTEFVIPEVKERLPLVDPKEELYGVIGASMGGLQALFTGLRLPKMFGKVLSQSGAFAMPEYHYSLVDLIRYTPPPEIQVWMDAGCFEWLLEGNRKMYALLKKKEYKVKFREFAGGHNYTAWRNDISHGLKKLFGK